MQAQMLAPAAVLVAWTLTMLFWMAGTRLPALAKLKDNPDVGKPGARGRDLDGVIPDKTAWKGHNLDHLHEQPTIFYATVIILALMGGGALDITLAWVYVGLRIVHSFWQALINTIPVRITLFTLSSIVLVVLAVRAVSATLFFDPGLAPS